MFLSSLTDPVAGYETSAARFFGGGGRSRPAEVAGGTLSDRADGAGQQAMFAMAATVRLAPGQAHTLVYADGYGDPPGVPPLVARLAAGARTALAASAAGWRQSLPRLTVPRDTWLARETAWDYYLRSSETYEDAWHLVRQSGVRLRVLLGPGHRLPRRAAGGPAAGMAGAGAGPADPGVRAAGPASVGRHPLRLRSRDAVRPVTGYRADDATTLQLAGARTLDSGVVNLTYLRAEED